ncbi:MAG: L-seryl-tRNA(Sec) selenium transferase [Candidatus Eisenbacteria bacterium]|nr:L-seryl-tRNA(Sec) selenium transferase [Candidatus Eisenbacteria bacterium]
MPLSSLRTLPSVEKLLGHDALVTAARELPRGMVVAAVRDTLAEAREALKRSSGGIAPDSDALAHAAATRARLATQPLLRRVLNATGIVLHTNLGRAPLADSARRAVADVAAGYSSLEYDLSSGKRGDRGLGIERWLTRLTGAEAAFAVNNGAGAILLALAGLTAGMKVIVSRGELVEIGGSFRVPEIMEMSGATLVEVGATNRTHLKDYEKALERHGREIGAILRVHRSNFRMQGFVKQPELADLAKLAKKKRIPLIEDLGSGALTDLGALGLEREPTVGDSLKAGASVVTCSGDKLLGGSQAGLVLGSRALIARIRKHPLARALRTDKLALAALESTLALHADPERARNELPVLAMLGASEAELAERAERLAFELSARVKGLECTVVRGEGEVGGGSLPLQKLPGPVVAVTHVSRSASELEALARTAQPPVIGIVRANRFRLDPRTLSESEIAMAATALAGVWRVG